MPRGDAKFTGPIPKHSSERVRRNADVVPIETISMTGRVDQPELGLPNPHPQTVQFYKSLAESAQAKYYEPSDWEYAKFTMYFVDRLLKSVGEKGPSAVLLASVNTMLTNLLVTEGDRRRVRIEVERAEAMGNNVVDVSAMLRDRAKSG